MFDWLFEGRISVYLLLAALTVILLVVWGQTRKRSLLLAVLSAAALIGLYALLGKLVETDREQLVRKVNELAAAANAGNVDGLLANVSDTFRSPQGKDKQQLRALVSGYLQNGTVRNVRVWDITIPNAPSREHPPAKVFFRAKAESGREIFADCEATFDYHAEHGWRLQGIELYNPGTNEKWPFQL